MGQIKVTPCDIEGLYIIEPTVHGDNRGYFMETYNQNDMHEAGLDMVFVQDNQSSSTKGVLRGLHFQKEFPQGKLVRVIKGSVFDVAVDLRAGSKTYGKWFGVELTEENKKQFFIPKGFAHGFAVLSETAVFQYKCDNFYHPEADGGISILDDTLGIDWKIPTEHANTQSAGLFGKGSEEHGQTLPAVLVPNGQNFWTPQTQDTEQKCIAPYYYKDSLLQGFRCSHWIVGGCMHPSGGLRE